MSKLPSFDRIDVIGRKTAKFATYSLGILLLALFFGALGGWVIAKPLLVVGVTGLVLSAVVFRRMLSYQEAKVQEFARVYRNGDFLLGLR